MIYNKPSVCALGQPLQKRSPASDRAYQRYHTVGGANGTTMVVMFVGWLCSGRQYIPFYSYCRNPHGREFFVPARTQIVVKLSISTS